MKRFALLLLVLAACPELEPPVSKVCAKAYEKCLLPDGPLGVCEVVPCPPGGSAPCFKCTSQH